MLVIIIRLLTTLFARIAPINAMGAQHKMIRIVAQHVHQESFKLLQINVVINVTQISTRIIPIFVSVSYF